MIGNNDLERGSVALRGILEHLEGDALELADPYAEAALQTARAAAGGHPTRQARMAASGLVADHGHVIAPSGSVVTGSGGRPASLAEIVAGAEWGSTTYPQFAARNARGYWLIPSFDAGPTLEAGDRALEEIVRSVVR